jgi:thymidylate kinase
MNRTIAFTAFTEFLNAKNIKYAVLGDTSAYPEEIGSDVDFIITKKDYLQIEKIIKEFCVKNKFTLIQKIEHERNASFFVITYADKDSNFYIQLDFCYDYTRMGRDYLEGATLLKNSISAPTGSFNILAPSYSFLYYFIKKVDKGNVNDKQFAALKAAYEADKTGTSTLLKEIFSSATVIKIEDLFQRSKNIDSLQPLVKDFQRELFLVKKKSLPAKADEIFRKLKRIFRPTGLIIGVLGRDGTGKSTLINHLEIEMSLVFRKINYYHLYPGLILSNKKKDDFSNPHIKPKRSVFASLLKLSIFYFEYTLGYWYKLYPVKVKSTLIIMDRYFVDIYADPDRYRNSGSKHIVWLIHKLLPKPDLWLILDASTEAVFKRKQEVEFSVSETQRKSYLELGKKIKNAYVLDTEKDIKEEVLLAAEIINKKLASKFI